MITGLVSALVHQRIFLRSNLHNNPVHLLRTRCCSTSTQEQELSAVEYDKLSNEVLGRLADFFDELGEKYDLSTDYDVQHAYGVLKVHFGNPIGTYVINRQAPNKQLWLSSPRSGPKRYDYSLSKRQWVYKHDGSELLALIEEEISDVVKSSVTIPKI